MRGKKEYHGSRYLTWSVFSVGGSKTGFDGIQCCQAVLSVVFVLNLLSLPLSSSFSVVIGLLKKNSILVRKK